MHRNGRTVELSSLKPYEFSLPARDSGVRPTIVCRECKHHRVLSGNLVFPHRADDGKTRCPGSGTRVIFDVTTEEWEQALYFATIATDRRRSKRVMVKAEPAPVAPLHRMAAARR